MKIGKILLGGVAVVVAYDYIKNKQTGVDSNIKHVYGSTEVDIQNAIDSTNAGRKIYLHDSFTINDTILLPSDTLLDLSAGKLTAANGLGYTKPMIRNSDIVNGNSNITVNGGEIDGNRANRQAVPPGKDSLWDILIYKDKTIANGKKCNNILVENCYIHNTPKVAVSYVNCYNSLISNCIFENNGWTSADIYIFDEKNTDWVQSINSHVTNCTFKNTTCGVSPGWGSNMKVTNCKFSNLTNYGVYCDGAKLTTVSNNTFDNCYPASIGGGCVVGIPVDQLTITGNTISNTTVGIEVACGSKGFHTITNNNGSNVTTGIKISSGNKHGSTISGNTGLPVVCYDDPYSPYRC